MPIKQIIYEIFETAKKTYISLPLKYERGKEKINVFQKFIR